jgi:hypothetical protein
VYETELDEELWGNIALILDDPLAQKRIRSPTPRDKSVSLCRFWLAEVKPIAEGISHRHYGAVFLLFQVWLQIRVLLLGRLLLNFPYSRLLSELS